MRISRLIPLSTPLPANLRAQPGADDEADERRREGYAGHERAAKYDGGHGRLSWHVMRAI